MRPQAAAACVVMRLLVACLLASAAFVSAQESLAGRYQTASAVPAVRQQHAPARPARLARGDGARRGGARVRSAASAARGVAKAASAADLATYEREHAALLAIKASMPELDSTTWAMLGWNADTNHCTAWKGVQCTPEGDPAGRVTTLDLYNQNLYGRIPWEAIGELSSVSTLWLDDNPRFAEAEPPNTLDPDLPAKMPGLSSFWVSSTGLVGSIPESYGSLANLTGLGINANRLSGPIPSSLARCSKLKTFWAPDGNNLTAPIDGWAGWGSMAELENLALRGNPIGGVLDDFPWRNWTSLTFLGLTATGLTGSLSSEIASARSLGSLELNSNMLTGDLTPAIRAWSSSLKNLTWLNIGDNDFDSTLPPEIGGLTALEVFYAIDAGLKGPLPETLANARNLSVLNLGGNALTGDLTPAIRAWSGSLTKLQTLSLAYNNFSSVIPPEIGGLTDLRQLFMYNAGLTGPLPPTLANARNLRVLNLESNRLTGDLSPAIRAWSGVLTQLEYLVLRHNSFSSTLPPEIGGLPALVLLFVDKAGLKGMLPATLGNLDKLQQLDASDNMFDSMLPPEIGRLPALWGLYVNRAGLRGPLPDTLALATNLKEVSLSFNSLSGPIPDIFAAHTKLDALYIASNKLTGSVPPSLCRLKTLTTLYLNDNQLNGQLCPELAGATEMRILSLAFNQLTGPLPAAWGSWTAMQELWLRGNKLSGGLPAAWGPMLATLRRLHLDANCLRGSVPCSWGNVSTANGGVQGIVSLCRNPVSQAVCGPSGATLNGCLPYSGTELTPAAGVNGPAAGREQFVQTQCVVGAIPYKDEKANLTYIPFNTGTGLTGFCGAPAFSMPTSPAGADSSMVCAASADPANCTSSPLLGSYAKGPASGVMASPQENTEASTCEAGTNMGAFEVACATSDAGTAALRFNLTIINAQLINRIRFYAGCTPPVAPGGGRTACSQWRPLPANYKRVRGSNGTFDSISWSAPLAAGCGCADAHNSIFIRSGTKCRA